MSATHFRWNQIRVGTVRCADLRLLDDSHWMLYTDCEISATPMGIWLQWESAHDLIDKRSRYLDADFVSLRGKFASRSLMASTKKDVSAVKKDGISGGKWPPESELKPLSGSPSRSFLAGKSRVGK